MLSYNEADRKYRYGVFKYLEFLLEEHSLEPYFHVVVSDSKLFIRQSVTNPPNQIQIDNFYKLFSQSPLVDLLESKKEQLSLMSNYTQANRRFNNTPSVKINKINITKLNDEFSVFIPDFIPGNIDLSIWSIIPEEVKNHWQKFNEPLQKYIVECIKENQKQTSTSYLNLSRKQASFSSNTSLTKDADRVYSPITLEKPTIPIRLSSATDAQVYNLEEILQLDTFEDPITDQSFSLEQLVPAPEAKDDLQKRMTEQSSGDQSPADLEEIDLDRLPLSQEVFLQLDDCINKISGVQDGKGWDEWKINLSDLNLALHMEYNDPKSSKERRKYMLEFAEATRTYVTTVRGVLEEHQTKQINADEAMVKIRQATKDYSKIAPLKDKKAQEEMQKIMGLHWKIMVGFVAIAAPILGVAAGAILGPIGMAAGGLLGVAVSLSIGAAYSQFGLHQAPSRIPGVAEAEYVLSTQLTLPKLGQ